MTYNEQIKTDEVLQCGNTGIIGDDRYTRSLGEHIITNRAMQCK